MSVTKETFEKACSHALTLANVSEANMLLLYGAYKQAREGPCNIPKPYFWDFAGKAKWESWNQVRKLSQEEAMTQYVKIVQRLDEGWNPDDPSHNSKASRKSNGGGGMGVSVSTMRPLDEEETRESDKTVFHYCEEGNVVEIQRLLKSRPELVDSRDPDRLTLLHWAVDRNHDVIVDYLIACGCDVNAVDSDSQTALHYAATSERLKIAKALLKAGADKSLKDIDGNTAKDCCESDDILTILKA